MGLFTYMPAERKIKGFAGREHNVPMYLQFITGCCLEVCHDSENLFHKAPNQTNSIMAKPHQTNKVFKTNATSYTEDDRYYPLLRTMHDVPSKGDPVLLTSFGGVNYYLGPLNMITNSPTWNNDINFKSELIGTNSEGATTNRGQKGESLNFNKDDLFARLTKKRNDELDYGDTQFETTGDTLIEGRHGNSLRIGSRSDNPYIFISNERDSENVIESVSDGTLISITSEGTLSQHFGKYIDENNIEINGFKLASDSISDNPNPFPIGDIYSDLNNSNDTQQGIYEYSENQILINSDRITFNSKLDDIFISSIKDVHIGSHRNIAISAGREIDIIASTVYIGNPYRGGGLESQPMVLGDNLKDVLNEMLALIENLEIFTGQAGIQTPKKSPTAPVFNKKVTSISDKIKSITSNFHEIEAN